jgi:Na+-transporting NADH:ubiquinone oxidoreductase subunit E
MDVNIFGILFGAIFVNNILLARYLGMCSFLAVSKQVKTAVGLGMAVIFVVTFTSMINWVIYEYVLQPLEIEYLRYIVFIVVIAAFVQLVEMVIERISDALYAALGIFLPLITVNCSILGVSLFMIIEGYDFIPTIFFGLGSGIGWALAIIAMAGIREKMSRARIPEGLVGAGITLIISGIMAFAFMGFSGMI